MMALGYCAVLLIVGAVLGYSVRKEEHLLKPENNKEECPTCKRPL